MLKESDVKELELCAKKLVINKECSDVLEASELATINLQLQQRMDKLEREGEAMSTANAEMQQLLSVIPLVLIGVSRNDRVILWNKLAETTFGIASINAIGRKLHECGIQWEWEKVDKMVLKSQEVDKLSQTDTVRYVVQGGNRGFLDVTVIPSLSETVEMEHVLILGRDVTEWKKIGDQMVQIQKLEAIGQLASGIAHEINSPIQYISDNTRFLKEAFADICKLLKHYSHLLELNKTKSVSAVVIDEIESECRKTDLEYLLEEIPEAIGQSQEGIARVTEIVKAMKSFSHPGSEEVVPVDINEAIRSTITVARNEWKYVADMKTDFDPILPMIPCFPSEFNQVILNMIINATHAIEELQCDGVGGGVKA